jgi:hypothetical protein
MHFISEAAETEPRFIKNLLARFFLYMLQLKQLAQVRSSRNEIFIVDPGAYWHLKVFVKAGTGQKQPSEKDRSDENIHGEELVIDSI